MIRLLLLLFLAAHVLSGCVPLNTHGALREAYNKADAEKEAARKEAAQASAELRRLQQELAPLRAANEALTRQVKELQASLQQLNQEKAALAEQIAPAKAPLAAQEGERVAAIRPLETAKASLPVPKMGREKAVRSLGAALKDEIARGRGFVRQGENSLTVGLSEEVLYRNSSSAAIKPDGLMVLKRIADVLKDGADKEIRVEASTDASIPSARFPANADLSVARANEVVRYFRSQDVVGPGRLLAIGYAGPRPAESNEKAQAKTRSGRVDIIVTFR